MHLRPFLHDAFTVNEQLGDSWSPDVPDSPQPLDDESLESFIRQEFFDNPKVIASLDETASFNKSRIRIWRSEFNRGLWDEKPTYKSFRYYNGVPVNRNLHPLSPVVVALEIVRFKFDDPRKAGAMAFLTKEGILDASPKSETG